MSGPSSPGAETATAAEKGEIVGKQNKGARGPVSSPLLCTPQKELSYVWSGAVAVAADENGHFTLYARPDPEAGRPTLDSHGLLQDCHEPLSFANLTSFRVGGSDFEPTTDPAGAGTVARHTRERGGALVTEYRFAGGVKLGKSLRVVGAPDSGARDTVEISFKLRNASDERRVVGLRSLLFPTPSGKRRPSLLVSYPADRALVEGGEEILNERNLLRAADQIPPYFVIPRRGAASDSTGWWSTGAGVKPDRITFAGWLELSGAPFVYEIRLGWPLPENPAFAVYWTGVELAPGEERLVGL